MPVDVHVRVRAFLLMLSLFAGSAGAAFAEDASAPAFPGKVSQWNGFSRYDFEIDGRPVLVVAPKEPLAGNPWVWHGEFFGHKPAPDIALLGRGFHIVYMSVLNMLGCAAC